ncbi:hypothetical protein PRZ48_013886 [Zasmidium cellare]|uniref:Uncharacterized protein n=1 Tax=Zasmidium cellare TaxID=395010 RepID=A0ABR0DZU0_ZASCE|nr:hypothetical protein PRZ48_013886 [Zasmidium cellare]
MEEDQGTLKTSTSENGTGPLDNDHVPENQGDKTLDLKTESPNEKATIEEEEWETLKHEDAQEIIAGQYRKEEYEGFYDIKIGRYRWSRGFAGSKYVAKDSNADK